MFAAPKKINGVMYRAMCTDGAFDDHLTFPEGKTKQLS